jgi:hypothetical protein
MWNLYEMVLNRTQRTANALEGILISENDCHSSCTCMEIFGTYTKISERENEVSDNLACT